MVAPTPGIQSCCPMDKVFVVREFTSIISSIDVLNFLEIEYKVSPFSTVQYAPGIGPGRGVSSSSLSFRYKTCPIVKVSVSKLLIRFKSGIEI